MAQTFTEAEIAAEEWRPVARDPRRWVSNLGRIWNRETTKCCGRIHTGVRKPSGYVVVTLEGQHRAVIGVHRLVLETFVGPAPSAGHEAAHWDGVRDNNRLSNLRWATAKENMRDRLRHGTWGRKITPEVAAEVQRRRQAGESSRGIAHALGITCGIVNSICRRSSWTPVTEEWTYRRQPKPTRTCINCAAVSLRVWRDRCDSCYEYRRRTGRDRVVGADGRVPPKSKRAPAACRDCGLVRRLHREAWCNTCYEYRRRGGLLDPDAVRPTPPRAGAAHTPTPSGLTEAFVAGLSPHQQSILLDIPWDEPINTEAPPFVEEPPQTGIHRKGERVGGAVESGQP